MLKAILVRSSRDSFELACLDSDNVYPVLSSRDSASVFRPDQHDENGKAFSGLRRFTWRVKDLCVHNSIPLHLALAGVHNRT